MRGACGVRCYCFLLVQSTNRPTGTVGAFVVGADSPTQTIFKLIGNQRLTKSFIDAQKDEAQEAMADFRGSGPIELGLTLFLPPRAKNIGSCIYISISL